MKTLRQVYRDVLAALNAVSIEEAEQDARLLIMEAFKLSLEAFAFDMEKPLDETKVGRLNDMVEQRVSRMPMSQIFGEKEFWSLTFKVTPDTLTPRPDSETLITSTLKHVSDKTSSLNILDLGTGTGCLLLSLLTELLNARGMGVDISEEALKVSRFNANQLGLEERSSFKQSNWFSGIEATGQFDVIISNPPYIGLTEKASLSPEVKDHEPDKALFSGEDGLDDYRTIANDCDQYLKADGILVLEIGYKQAGDVNEIFTSAGFNEGTLYQDLGNRDRCLVFHKRKILE